MAILFVHNKNNIHTIHLKSILHTNTQVLQHRNTYTLPIAHLHHTRALRTAPIHTRANKHQMNICIHIWSIVKY